MTTVTLDRPGGQPAAVAHYAAAAGVTDRAGEQRDQVSGDSQSIAVSLFDPSLAALATLVDDLEDVREGNASRLRIMTRPVDEPDADGVCRGWGLPDDHPGVAVIRQMHEGIRQVEHEAVLALQRQMRRHPLGPWQRLQHGVGEKQLARLLGSIGDPYWNTAEDRPRTVSELWAYCGYKPGQKRRKGQQSNWSNAAKSYAWNIAQSTLKAGGPWRELWDERRAATEGRVHQEDCAQCKARPGDPLRPGHLKADADRYVAKRLLRELWRESKRLHDELAEGQTKTDAQD
jgi:hypothetical protein